jgi:hypothetical protein
MRRATNPAVWLPTLLLAAASAFAPRAQGQACESARPTDPAGAAGVGYGAAQVGFLDSTSGRARMHYALSGPHVPPPASTLQDGVPDAVVVAAQAADDAFAKYDELSYAKPLSDADSPCASNGDSDAVDIYLIQFSAADGQAVFDHCDPGPPKRCSGFVLVESDFKGGGYSSVAEGMRTVVPHELFHLVQDAYDADVERWWAEGSAQWAAKQVYPDLLDLERFLPGYFDNPWRPLNVPPLGAIPDFLYATAIWPVFLNERYDVSIVRQVYEGFGPDEAGVLPTTDAVLKAQGSSLAADFLQFAAYNAATGTRAPETGGYADAAKYPLVPIKALDATQPELVRDVASGLGAFYYSVTANPALQLSLDADADRVTGLWLPLADGKLQLSDAKPLPATAEGEGVVVVAGQSLSRTDAPFILNGQAPPGGTTGTGADGAKSSGCSASGNLGQNVAPGGAALPFVVILLGRCRARSRRRKVP